MSVLPPDALRERLQALIRPGDTLWWGQATAEPLTLTRAVVAQRQALAQHGGQGRLRVFVGMGASDTLQPAHADAIDFFGYAAGGPHRALAQAGVLDILPSHYSHLPGLIDEGLLPADVVLLQDELDLQVDLGGTAQPGLGGGQAPAQMLELLDGRGEVAQAPGVLAQRQQRAPDPHDGPGLHGG